MINLLILIPVHGREEVRRMAFDALIGQDSIARGKWIRINIWHAESSHDSETLGAKLNRELGNVRDRTLWDYIMVLGSDDLLRPQVWGYIATAIAEGIPCFGFNQAYLYDRLSHRAKIWDAGAGTFGAGRCVRRDVVEKCGWKLWDDNKNNGIDGSQERILLGVGEPIHIIQTHIPVVCDIKDNDNLNSYDDVPGLPVSAARVRELFPALEAWSKPANMWVTTATSDPIGGDSISTG